QSILLREREVELGYLRDRRRPRRGGSSPAALATGALGGGRRETAVPQSAYRRIVEPRRPAAAGYSRNQRANRTPGVPASGAGSFILAAPARLQISRSASGLPGRPGQVRRNHAGSSRGGRGARPARRSNSEIGA